MHQWHSDRLHCIIISTEVVISFMKANYTYVVSVSGQVSDLDLADFNCTRENFSLPWDIRQRRLDCIALIASITSVGSHLHNIVIWWHANCCLQDSLFFPSIFFIFALSHIYSQLQKLHNISHIFNNKKPKVPHNNSIRTHQRLPRASFLQ